MRATPLATRSGVGQPTDTSLPPPPSSSQDAPSTSGAARERTIWLAGRGWRVTASDVSPVALQRGADHAAAVGAEVAKRIDWQQQDAQVWGPEPSSFDLVSAQFMQLPPAPRGALFGRLADGVAPGGTLLIVGHHPSDLETTVPRGSNPDLLFTASEVAALLDSEEWEVVVEAAPERTIEDPDDNVVTIRDALLLARRHE